MLEYSKARTTDTQWRHKSKISEKLGRCGRQNMLPPYLKIWDWDWIFGRAVKAISSLGVRSPWFCLSCLIKFWLFLTKNDDFYLKPKTNYRMAEGWDQGDLSRCCEGPNLYGIDDRFDRVKWSIIESYSVYKKWIFSMYVRSKTDVEKVNNIYYLWRHLYK